jgi:hypothetical protein
MSDITVSVTAQPAIEVGVTPAGATGPQGPVGPVAVSADEGNVAILGSDDLIYVPESSGGGAVDSVAGKTGVVVLEKADVGLANVDNTADADKPVSTATASALADKAGLASPTFTGNPTAPTAAPGDNDTTIATTAFVTAAVAAGGGGGGAAQEVRHSNEGTYDYTGTAPNGTAEGSSGWTVTRITLTSPPVVMTGSGTWTGRAGLSYS